MAMTKREFYEILMNQPEEAKDIALSLELFCQWFFEHL